MNNRKSAFIQYFCFEKFPKYSDGLKISRLTFLKLRHYGEKSFVYIPGKMFSSSLTPEEYCIGSGCQRGMCWGGGWGEDLPVCLSAILRHHH